MQPEDSSLIHENTPVQRLNDTKKLLHRSRARQQGKEECEETCWTGNVTAFEAALCTSALISDSKDLSQIICPYDFLWLLLKSKKKNLPAIQSRPWRPCGDSDASPPSWNQIQYLCNAPDFERHGSIFMCGSEPMFMCVKSTVAAPHPCKCLWVTLQSARSHSHQAGSGWKQLGLRLKAAQSPAADPGTLIRSHDPINLALPLKDRESKTGLRSDSERQIKAD